jgi:hypothetical protein
MGGYDGVGFVFHQADPYCGVDLDHCMDPKTGEVQPWALEAVQALNSYTERSPSGEGLHVFIRAKHPGGGKKRIIDHVIRAAIEVYDSGRYFTVTAQHLPGTPITVEDRQAELAALHAQFFTKPEKHREQPAASPSPDDAALLEKARRAKKGAEFDALFRGQWEGRYGSHSEADLALCAFLAFWTDVNPGRIDRLFRQSGLYRQKWDKVHRSDGRTYGQATIDKALGAERDFYDGNRGATKPQGARTDRTPIALSSREGEDEGPAITPWPVLPEAALHGILGDIVQLATARSEADPAAVLMTALTWAAATIGTGPHFFVGDDRHYARLFAVLVGASSRARKGTSTASVRRLFELAQAQLMQSAPPYPGRLALAVSPGPLSSGEGLVYAVRDASDVLNKDGEPVDAGVSDKRLLVIESELAAPLKAAQREGNTLSAILRTAWDHGNIAPLTETNRTRATGAHINFVGHITQDELRVLLQTADIWNGFANRILWAAVRRTKCVPFAQPMPEEAAAELAARLADALRHAFTRGVASFHPGAAKEWIGIYPTLTDDRSGVLGAVTSRAEAQVIRLALLYSLMDPQAQLIEVDHLRAALAVWQFCDESARYIFGEADADPAVNRLMAALESGPKTRTELNALFSGHLSSDRITDILSRQQALGRITMHRERSTGGGRLFEHWKLMR